MSVKKFISGISALAVAAGAFAAMAVTVSATDYGPTDYTANFTTVKKSTWTSGGVFTAQALNNGEYAAAYLNFSALQDIDKATSVTVTFDTYVYANTVTCYGFGDASQRSAIANSSGIYRTGGLAAYFGSTNGTDYKINDIKSSQSINCGSGYFAAKVPASITFDKAAGTYSFTIGAKTATMPTNITNLTYIDAYTNTSAGKFGLMNVKVSYTVPDEGAEGVAATGTDYEGTDGTKASLWNGTVAANAATKVTAVATLADGVTTASGETALDGTFTGDVEVYVVVNKAMAELSGVTISFE